jgi:hypothetical protein
MRGLLILGLVFFLTAPGRAGAREMRSSDPDPFASALAEIGLSRETFTFDYADMSNYGGDRYALPLFFTLHSDPFKVEDYAKTFRDNLLDNCGRIAPVIAFASLRLDEGVRRGLIASPLERVEPLVAVGEPLYQAILEMQRFHGHPAGRRADARLRNAASAVPLPVQRAAAAIIHTSMDSLRYHEHAFAGATQEFDLVRMHRRVQDIFSEEDIVDLEIERFIDGVDLKYLFTPAQDIAMAVDYAADSLARYQVYEDYDFQWETPLGKVVLRGSGTHIYRPDQYFIIIDTGGNDIYEGGAANRSPENWISVVIDTGGNDTYGTGQSGAAALASGIFGYAYLVDLAGNDTYRAGDFSLGSGLFGVGALLDASGDDVYEGYMVTQGAGIFGIGLLADLGGTDRYHCYQQGQGFGFSKGFGILIDSAGDDMYLAEDSDIVFPSPQTEDHNASLAQGVGFGKRADFVDGHSWGGGIGFLIDGAGNDHYSAGLFAQGCAYWYAIGLLADAAGNDVYEGVWYVQGSGAHFGLGVLVESAGDDVYNAEINMAQGAGHDFTLGMLVEEAGNDIYNAPNLSLGGGNANGIGILWDKHGDDRYNSTAKTTLGRANTSARGGLRDYINTIGLFLDTGGDDRYPLAYPDSVQLFQNNSIWTRPGLNTDTPLETERGVGYDCESGAVPR